jgi:hypothetical protein
MVLQVVRGAPYLASVWFVDEWPLASPNLAVMVVEWHLPCSLPRAGPWSSLVPLSAVCVGRAQQILPAVGR